MTSEVTSPPLLPRRITVAELVDRVGEIDSYLLRGLARVGAAAVLNTRKCGIIAVRVDADDNDLIEVICEPE